MAHCSLFVKIDFMPNVELAVSVKKVFVLLRRNNYQKFCNTILLVLY